MENRSGRGLALLVWAYRWDALGRTHDVTRGGVCRSNERYAQAHEISGAAAGGGA